MKLSFTNEAEVPQAKIVRYLLDPSHRAGKSKARFFLSRGFTVERWEELAEALRRHAGENEIAKRDRTPLGERFIVEGPMPLPDGSVAQFGQYGLLNLANGYRGWPQRIPCEKEGEDDQRIG